MARALRLAWRGRFSAHPNPRVGCVIVRDGVVVGEGWHEISGGPHAEVVALGESGELARGATVYVTLEPCAHQGKTPPCSDALIAAGVSKVIASMRDPFPDVSEQGFATLRAAGVDVQVGLMENDARSQNEGYLSRIERGRPFLRLKLAASLDGGTAMASGESRWLSGAQARADVQRLRAASGAIMTGIGTLLDDDPSLNVREPGLSRHPPLRVILDTRLRTPRTAKMLGLDGETIIYCGHDDGSDALRTAGAEIVETMVTGTDSGGRISPVAVLEDLAERGVNDVLAECGPTLAGSLLDAGLVDELVIYQTPHIMGSETRPMFDTPKWQTLGNRLSLRILDVRTVGNDSRITARPDATGR